MTTNIYDVLNLLNNTMPTMKFTLKEGVGGNKVSFLDITISKEENNISFNIYRKPTTTDTVIPSDCHPPKQTCNSKISNRVETYIFNATNKEKESNTINNYYTTINDTSFLNNFTPVDNITRLDRKNTAFSLVICALFFILTTEKSGCVKYADFFFGGLDLGKNKSKIIL
jgi:hypothetical protein